MPDTNTPNLNLVMPELGGSKGSWGQKLNSNMLLLDTAINNRLTQAQGDARYLRLAGGTMTGMITLTATNPTVDNHATRKAYVDAQVNTRLTQAQGDARYVNIGDTTTAGALHDVYSRVNIISSSSILFALYQRTTTNETRLSVSADGTIVANGTGGMTHNFFQARNSPVAAADLTRKDYVDARDALQVTKSGDTMTGQLNMGSNQIRSDVNPVAVQDLTRKNYVDAQDALQVTKAGDTMTGMLTLPATNPTVDNHAARKGYVDTQVATRLTQAVADGRYAQLAGSGVNDFGPNMTLRTEGYGGTSTNGYGWALDSASTGASARIQNPTGSANTNPSYLVIQGTTITFRVNNNGNVQNTNNSYGAISDRSLKANIKPAKPQLADLLKLEVVNYNLKGQKLKQIGLIAQDVQKVKPGWVYKDPDSGKLGIQYSLITLSLLKGLQELAKEFYEFRDSVKQ